MRKVVLVCVGSLKEKYWREAMAEYIKRLSRYFDFRIIELNESKLTKSTEAEIRRVVEEESARVLEKIKGKTALILAVEGEEISSPDFAHELSMATDYGEVYLVIGGSYGLNAEVKRAGKMISFGRITYPHQLMRVILAEQVYRAATILNNIEYHK